MLICFKCHRQDGVHDVFCPYIPDDEIVREFMVLNADLFESEPLTHPIGGEPRRIPIRSQGFSQYAKNRDASIHVMAMLDDWGIVS